MARDPIHTLKKVSPSTPSTAYALPRRTRAFIHREIQLEVARQLDMRKVARPESDGLDDPEALRKWLDRARATVSRYELESKLLESYRRYLPICRVLVASQMDLGKLPIRRALDTDTIHFLTSGKGQKVLRDVTSLKRYGCYKSDEAQAKFLARALTGVNFGLSVSASERTLGELLSRVVRILEPPRPECTTG